MSQQSEGNTKIRIPLYACIGSTIRRIREAKGLSQERLAELSGRSLKSENSMENGWSMVSVAQLYYLSEVLGVFIGDFFVDLVDPVKYPEIQESVTVSPSAKNSLHYIHEDGEAVPFVRDRELDMIIERLSPEHRKFLKATLRNYLNTFG